MRKTFFDQFKLNLHDLLHSLLGVLIPFLLLHLVTCAVMLIVRPDESIFISGIFLPLDVGIMGLSVTSSSVTVNFDLAVRMGRTRREAAVLTALLSLAQNTLAALCAQLLLWWERNLSMPIWRFLSGNPELRVDDFGFIWWLLPVAALAGVVLGFVYGAAMLRYGVKANYMYLFVWFGGMFIVQALPWKTHEVINILIPVVILLIALSVVWAVRTLLKLSLRG